MNGDEYKKLLNFDTATVSDALDSLGINGGVEGVYPIGDDYKVVGPAYTVKFEEVQEGQQAAAADYIDDVPAESVIVLDNSGIRYCTVWGSILSQIAQLKKISGTVINGLCRDVDSTLKLNYPVFALGSYMKSGKNRVRMASKNAVLQIGKSTIKPGDYILADKSGVISVPKKYLAQVLEISQKIADMESEILQAIGDGVKLEVARKKYNYNQFSLKVEN